LLDFQAPPFTPEHADISNFYVSLFRKLLFTGIEGALYYFDVEQVKK